MDPNDYNHDEDIDAEIAAFLEEQKRIAKQNEEHEHETTHATRRTTAGHTGWRGLVGGDIHGDAPTRTVG